MPQLSKITKGMDVRDVDGKWIGKVLQRGTGRFMMNAGTWTFRKVIVDDDCVQDVGTSTIMLNVGWNHLVQAHAIGDDDAPILMEPARESEAPEARPPLTTLPPEAEPPHVALTGGASAISQEPAAWDESRRIPPPKPEN